MKIAVRIVIESLVLTDDYKAEIIITDDKDFDSVVNALIPCKKPSFKYKLRVALIMAVNKSMRKGYSKYVTLLNSEINSD